MATAFCSKRSKRITFGRGSQLCVSEGIYIRFSRFCSARNYSNATDAMVTALDHGLSVLGFPPESDAEIVRNSQIYAAGELR